MAADYTVIAQNRTVLVRSPTLVEDVEEVHAVTKPSGVTFVREVLYTTWQAGDSGPELETIAQSIEQIMRNHPVSSAGAVQDISSSGLLSNSVEFVVSIAGDVATAQGPMTATVTISVQNLHDLDDFSAFFAPVVSALEKTAAL